MLVFNVLLKLHVKPQEIKLQRTDTLNDEILLSGLLFRCIQTRIIRNANHHPCPFLINTFYRQAIRALIRQPDALMNILQAVPTAESGYLIF